MARLILVTTVLLHLLSAQAAVEPARPARLVPKQETQGENQLELWRQRRLLLKKFDPKSQNRRSWVSKAASKAAAQAKSKPAR
jgi:hypothetical protein